MEWTGHEDLATVLKYLAPSKSPDLVHCEPAGETRANLHRSKVDILEHPRFEHLLGPLERLSQRKVQKSRLERQLPQKRPCPLLKCDCPGPVQAVLTVVSLLFQIGRVLANLIRRSFGK
jgi:hypothetical protein